MFQKNKSRSTWYLTQNKNYINAVIVLFGGIRTLRGNTAHQIVCLKLRFK